MPYQIKVTGLTGSVKKIKSSDSRLTMGASAMWFSANASGVASQDVLANADLIWLLINGDSYVQIEFDADDGGSNGQGFHLPAGLHEMKVTSVTGTVKRLKCGDAFQSTTKTEAYTDGSSVAANDVVDPGDFLVCNAAGKFELKLTGRSDSLSPFTAVAVGLLAEATR